VNERPNATRVKKCLCTAPAGGLTWCYVGLYLSPVQWTW